MIKDTIIAVPSKNPGGLDSELSDHFGHCDVFTIINIIDGKIGNVEVLPNLPHEKGGCLAPVNYLSGKGVKVMIARGMGMRPLVGFNNAGIDVYYNNNLLNVADIISEYASGNLPKFSINNTCGGGSHQHGGGCHSH